jgi:hypothetical protein
MLASSILVVLYNFGFIGYIPFFETVLIIITFILYLSNRLHLLRYFLMNSDNFFEINKLHYELLKYSEYALLASIILGIYSFILLENIPVFIVLTFFFTYFFYTFAGLNIYRKYSLN